MKVPLSITNLENKELRIITDSLKTGWLTHGKHNLIFEKNFSKFVGVKYSISMNSCTSALECAVKLLKKKGEVIIPSWTWVSTANAVINSGCKPVFADVELNSRNISPAEIEKKITKKTIAVIVVHFGGMPCEMDKISKICKKNKIELIEDSAETIGATFKKKKTGSFGVGCFSFFPTKNMTTTEGGMLTTNNLNYFCKINDQFKALSENKFRSFIDKEIADQGIINKLKQFYQQVVRTQPAKILEGFTGSPKNTGSAI